MQRLCPLRPERLFPILILAVAACAGGYEHSASSRLDTGPWPDRRASARDGAPEFDGSLGGYLAEAMRDHPELEAAYESWRASVYSISRARRLPDPQLSYGYFLRSVETRVGPQRHRFSVRQMVPWPSKLSAGADAASDMARAAERAFETRALALRRRIADAYWRLWVIRRTREIHVSHKQLLSELAESVRARIAVGRAGLADVNQLDLRVSRMDDAIGTLDEVERGAAAALRTAVGVYTSGETPTTDPAPRALLPADDREAMLADAREHPRIRRLDFMAEASDDRAERAGDQGMPDFMLGLDYIETGPAAVDMPDSGKDPIILSVGIALPLWRGSYDDEADAARADAASLRAESAAAKLHAEADLDEALAHVADSARRIELHENTLIPQAESVYEAVVGAYQTGDSGLAALLLAQEDVLQLRVQLAEAHANHARAWAHLEHVVGREVETEEISHD